MKTTYGKILVLAMVVVLLTAALPCGAVEKEEKSIWSEDKPGRGHKRFELTEEKIEHIMNRLKKTNPEEAEELAKLREKDAEKFKAELRKVMRQHLGKKFRERGKERAGQRRGGRPGGGGGVPRMPGMPGMHGGGMQPGMGMYWRHGELLEWLEKNYPEEAEKLAGLKEKRPKLHTRQMALTLKKYRRIFEAEKENPELAEVLKEDLQLKQQRDKLLKEIETASGDEREELVGELKGVISSRFDLIVKRKQIEYEQMLKKLEKLKKRVEESESKVEKWKDAAFKNKSIKARLEELVGKADKFRW